MLGCPLNNAALLGTNIRWASPPPGRLDADYLPPGYCGFGYTYMFGDYLLLRSLASDTDPDANTLSDRTPYWGLGDGGTQ